MPTEWYKICCNVCFHIESSDVARDMDGIQTFVEFAGGKLWVVSSIYSLDVLRIQTLSCADGACYAIPSHHSYSSFNQTEMW